MRATARRIPFNSPITPSFQFSMTAAIDIALVEAAATGAGSGAELFVVTGVSDFALGAAVGAAEDAAGRATGALGS